MENEKRKIFVSYTQQDAEWALWIADTLKKQGHETIVMDWDFRPGDNFVLKMDEALLNSPVVVAVLSKAYLDSYHCQSELTAAYADKNLKLIPVRVGDFKVRGLWAPISYVDLVDKTEDEAIKLLEHIFKAPEKKSKGFPGKVSGDTKPQKDLTDTKRKSINPSEKAVPDEKVPVYTGMSGYREQGILAYARITGMVGMPSHNLPDRNNKFTGRVELLNDIFIAFHTNNEVSLIQSQAITGMGGIGKSETAKEYAYLHRNEYSHIWWINAETETGVLAAYRSFAEREKLGTPEDNSEKTIANVKKWMQEHNQWLFIFDNVENEKSLEKYCSASLTEGQHILITSRYPLFQKFTPVSINVFNETESCELIEKYTKKPADEHFRVLAKKMGYLPLALDQAGAYMYVHKKSYKEYLDLYNKYNLKLLEAYDDDPEKKTVATIWQISLDKIANPASKQLLYLCAFLSPDNFLPQWFQQANAVLPDELHELRDITADDLEYDKAIAELTKHSLVSQNENGFLNMHRLMQDVIRDSLNLEQSKWRFYCISILNKLRYFDFSTAESRALFIILASHVDSVTQEISDEEATEEVALLNSFLGNGFFELADYPKSLKYHNKTLAIREKVLGTEHPSIASSFNNIGMVYLSQDNFDLALEYYRKAQSIYEKILGTEHPDTASSFNNIGMVYGTFGTYDLALKYFEKALAIREKVLGTEHLDTAFSYNNIGFVYYSLGNCHLALEYYLKSLSIKKKALCAEHPSTANTYNNIGSVHSVQGNYDLAMEYYGKALSIREKVMGMKHPDTAISYINIGSVKSKQGNYDLALEYYGKALVIKEKVLGAEHPSTKTTYKNMADTYAASKNPEPFEEWLQKKMRELQG